MPEDDEIYFSTSGEMYFPLLYPSADLVRSISLAIILRPRISETQMTSHMLTTTTTMKLNTICLLMKMKCLSTARKNPTMSWMTSMVV